jgi:hypothetical protein
MAATFALGGVAGAGLVVLVRPPQEPAPPRIVYIDRPAAPPPSATPPSEPPAIAVDDLPAAPTGRSGSGGVPAPVASPASRGAQSQLAAERQLLDRARGALEQEDGAAALATIAEHERKYPDGILVQEREAMAVRALLLLGRAPEARARADRFKSRFPDSVLLPSIEAAVGQVPPGR